MSTSKTWERDYKKERPRKYVCPTHPERHSKLYPINECSNCLENYYKVKWKDRDTRLKNGTGTFGLPRGGTGKCGVCQNDNVRLSGTSLPSGLKICETCDIRFARIDSVASKREYILRDMRSAELPVLVGVVDWKLSEMDMIGLDDIDEGEDEDE